MSKMSLDRSRKFLKVCARLRLDSVAHVEGHLSQLWKAAHEAGHAVVGDPDAIELLAKWPVGLPDRYPPGALAAALIEAGFVDELVPGKLYAIHDWYDHAPEFVRKKVGRSRQEDPTIGPETYFLGRDRLDRELEAAGAERTDDRAELADDEKAGHVGGNSAFSSDHVETLSGGGGQKGPFFGTELAPPLDRQGKGSQGKGRYSPPSSPPALRPSGGFAESDPLRALTARAVDLIAQLRSASPPAAEILDEQAGDCETEDDWQTLIALAERALDQQGLDAPHLAHAPGHLPELGR